jgi:hypothetical protein
MNANDPANPQTHSQLFTTGPAVALPTSAPSRPEFVRMPRPGQFEPYSGLRRSQLYQLADEGLIQTITLRRRNKVRGTRLIVFDSLMAYLHGLKATQNPPKTYPDRFLSHAGDAKPSS